MPVMTGLSGNEIYCLHQKGLTPGDLVIGNSVFSLGFFGQLGSGLKTMWGGEVTQVTSIVHEGRQKSYERVVAEAEKHGGVGVTGVTSELIMHPGNIEFLSIGSCVHAEGQRQERLGFSTSADGQELYCQVDAGFQPVKFVFGNVAYSIGVGGGLMGGLRSLARGEVQEFSRIFTQTRRLALDRIATEAAHAGANAVVGIRTSIIPFQGLQEMVMVGTASKHPVLPPQFSQRPVTSDLTNEEMWNLIHIGYMPVQLVLGVSVYSLGFIGGITSAFKQLVRGEIPEMTTLIYEARENALEHIKRDAAAVGADDVVGVKVYVYELPGNLLEFMALGTAVKRMDGLATSTKALPPQAVIRDKETFINAADRSVGTNLNQKAG
ncbi:MAG TPA: heavy metal-binding domain-containing protein [Candidatus Xenobia bacterium]